MHPDGPDYLASRLTGAGGALQKWPHPVNFDWHLDMAPYLSSGRAAVAKAASKGLPVKMEEFPSVDGNSK